jgi:hypothetical protein
MVARIRLLRLQEEKKLLDEELAAEADGELICETGVIQGKRDSGKGVYRRICPRVKRLINWQDI